MKSYKKTLNSFRENVSEMFDQFIDKSLNSKTIVRRE